MGNEMGNNNTSTLKEEANTSEAEKMFLAEHVYEEGVNEQNQIIPAANGRDTDPKPAGFPCDGTSEVGNVKLQQDSNPNGVKGENQPTVQAKDDTEKAVKASDGMTVELGRAMLHEDSHGHQTRPAAAAEDAEVKAIKPASKNTTSWLENESSEGDNLGEDVNVENRMYPTAEAEEDQEKATGMASDNTESTLGKESTEEDTNQDVFKEENQLNGRAEELDIEEKSAEQASDHAANTLENDPLEQSENDIDANVEHQINAGTASLALDGKACRLKKDIDTKEKQGEIYIASIAEGTDVEENASDLASNDPVNVKDSFRYAVEDITEVRQEDKSPNAGSIESGSENENSEIFSRSEFEGTEEYERQKESSLKKNDLLRNDCHLDKESSIKKEQQDPTFSDNAELQESSDMDCNHDECAKIFPEPLLQGIKSQTRAGFLDTNLHCQKDKDCVDMEFQEKMLRTDKSNGKDGDEFVNGLRDKSGITSDSPNVGSNTNGGLGTKVNPITDDSLILLHESAIAEIPPEEKGTTRPEMENSHDYNPSHCFELPLKEFNDDVANGNFHAERNTVRSFNAYVHSRSNQVEEAKETENGHQLDECVNNHKKASDEINNDFVFPEDKADRLIAESRVADGRYGDVVNSKKKIIEEMDENPEAPCVRVKSNEGREISEAFYSNRQTLDQEESPTMHISSSSSSLLHSYNLQLADENQTRTITTTIMPNSDFKQANDKSFSALADKKDTSNLAVPPPNSVDDDVIEKEGKDSSQQLEGTSAANLSDESYSVISAIANGGCEGMESITRLSTESNPDISITSAQMQKSPSFNINLRVEARSAESDQIPLLSQEKTTTESLSNQTNHSNLDSTFHAEYDQRMIKNEEVEIEEKVVTMERSYSEKSKAPFLGLLKEEEEIHLLVVPQEQGNHGGGSKKAAKEVASTSAKGEEKRKPKPSFFSSCMCCAAVMN